MTQLGKALRDLRLTLKVSQSEMAERLGITNVHVSNIENLKASPSLHLIEEVRKQFGVDLYIYAWCKYGDYSKLPPSVRRPLKTLAKQWEADLAKFENEN